MKIEVILTIIKDSEDFIGVNLCFLTDEDIAT